MPKLLPGGGPGLVSTWFNRHRGDLYRFQWNYCACGALIVNFFVVLTTLKFSPKNTYQFSSQIKSRCETSFGNYRLSAFSPDVSTLKAESLDSVLIGNILFIFSHPINCLTTPEIFQNPITKFSRGGIYKTSVQAEIMKILKRWNLSTIRTGRNIARFSRDGICKTSVQAEVFQNIKSWNL